MDVPFLMDLVRECKTSTKEIALPRYDKSQHSGRGDRAPLSEWDRKQGEAEYEQKTQSWGSNGAVVISCRPTGCAAH
jgi:hypothetical protein